LILKNLHWNVKERKKDTEQRRRKVKDGRKEKKKKTEKRRKTGDTEKTKTERGQRKEKESFCDHQRRECRSFAHHLVRHLWHSEQAGFAGISFSFSFLVIFQS